MAKYQVELAVFVDAESEDEASRIVDSQLDYLWQRGLLLAGFEIPAGTATELEPDRTEGDT